MTATEIMAIGGGLVVGYWIVAVLLPELGRHRDDPEAGDPGPPEDAEAGDGETAGAETAPRDQPTIRREM